MDVQEKMQLIYTLGARFGWLIRASVKRYEIAIGGHNFPTEEMWLEGLMEVSFVSGDFVAGIFSSGNSILRKSDHGSYGYAVKSICNCDTFDTFLGYDYMTESVVFEIDTLTGVDVSYEFPSHLLEFLKEEDIRRVFREKEQIFLRQTKTTRADWRIEEF